MGGSHQGNCASVCVTASSRSIYLMNFLLWTYVFTSNFHSSRAVAALHDPLGINLKFASSWSSHFPNSSDWFCTMAMLVPGFIAVVDDSVSDVRMLLSASALSTPAPSDSSSILSNEEFRALEVISGGEASGSEGVGVTSRDAIVVLIQVMDDAVCGRLGPGPMVTKRSKHFSCLITIMPCSSWRVMHFISSQAGFDFSSGGEDCVVGRDAVSKRLRVTSRYSAHSWLAIVA